MADRPNQTGLCLFERREGKTYTSGTAWLDNDELATLDLHADIMPHLKFSLRYGLGGPPIA